MPLKKEEYEKLAAFRYELRKFLRFSERAAKQHGLTPQQHQALLAMEGFPGRNGVTIGELSERLQVAAHAAVELANRLETAGFAQRVASEEDRRQVYLKLTAQGRERLGSLTELHRRELQTAGPLLIKELTRILAPE
ncbi:MAG TPA: MarR family transcriptional regulator [Chthoniobacteraceae bacterium]|nr:MarR family transcriptional regulator [Chthoniobacteraceae bacterium]